MKLRVPSIFKEMGFERGFTNHSKILTNHFK